MRSQVRFLLAPLEPLLRRGFCCCRVVVSVVLQRKPACSGCSFAVQTASASSGGSQSPGVQVSAKAKGERRKGVSIAESVSAMTKVFMTLAVIVSLVIAFQKDQYGEVSGTNIGIAIGFAIAAIFQGLLVLMIAQYIIAKLTD